MPWYLYLAYFFGGAFLANAVPHFVQGVSGHPFPSPFASPPGKGLSSPIVNVLWAAFNAVVGYLLVFHVGAFHARDIADISMLGTGALIISLLMAREFGKRPTTKQ
jgi:hypothetical protein